MNLKQILTKYDHFYADKFVKDADMSYLVDDFIKEYKLEGMKFSDFFKTKLIIQVYNYLDTKMVVVPEDAKYNILIGIIDIFENITKSDQAFMFGANDLIQDKEEPFLVKHKDLFRMIAEDIDEDDKLQALSQSIAKTAMGCFSGSANLPWAETTMIIASNVVDLLKKSRNEVLAKKFAKAYDEAFVIPEKNKDETKADFGYKPTKSQRDKLIDAVLDKSAKIYASDTEAPIFTRAELHDIIGKQVDERMRQAKIEPCSIKLEEEKLGAELSKGILDIKEFLKDKIRMYEQGKGLLIARENTHLSLDVKEARELLNLIEKGEGYDNMLGLSNKVQFELKAKISKLEEVVRNREKPLPKGIKKFLDTLEKQQDFINGRKSTLDIKAECWASFTPDELQEMINILKYC
ncbi:MAG: hypothetical protein IT245_03790 [Bacteroidia bacterium]|nr:hypothetical protein [Bacteroidia bacterium]